MCQCLSVSVGVMKQFIMIVFYVRAGWTFKKKHILDSMAGVQLEFEGAHFGQFLSWISHTTGQCSAALSSMVFVKPYIFFV